MGGAFSCRFDLIIVIKQIYYLTWLIIFRVMLMASPNTTLVMAVLFIALGSAAAGVMLLQFHGGGEDPSRIPHGIYVWDGSRFSPINVSNAYVPREPGYYFLYFHNNLCPHCQAFYPEFVRYLREYGGVFRNITVVEIVCDWFDLQCSSDAAKNSFRLYQVSYSPAFLLIKVGSSGKIEGIWDISREYTDLKNQGKIPEGEFQPQYVEAIVRSKLTT
jgi:thiol-disulfide isomerase/thioredoxin